MKPLIVLYFFAASLLSVQTMFAESRVNAQMLSHADGGHAQRYFFDKLHRLAALWQDESREHVEQVLGDPVAKEYIFVKNRHDSTVTDVIEKWMYAEQQVWFYLATSREVEFIIRIDPVPASPGVEEEQIRQWFGQPVRSDARSRVYSLASLLDDAPELILQVENGRSISMVLIKYVD